MLKKTSSKSRLLLIISNDNSQSPLSLSCILRKYKMWSRKQQVHVFVICKRVASLDGHFRAALGWGYSPIHFNKDRTMFLNPMSFLSIWNENNSPNILTVKKHILYPFLALTTFIPLKLHCLSIVPHNWFIVVFHMQTFTNYSTRLSKIPWLGSYLQVIWWVLGQ